MASAIRSFEAFPSGTAVSQLAGDNMSGMYAVESPGFAFCQLEPIVRWTILTPRSVLRRLQQLVDGVN